MQSSCTVEGGVGDVGNLHLWLDGGMARGNAQILPPPGAGKVPGEGGKRMVRWCPCNKILHAHHVAMGGGVYARLLMGSTWTWASLGFPTGLVRMELNSWSMVAG